jgi:hypothetical protein
MIDAAVVLNAHENSPVFRDTLDSVRHYWTDEVLVVADAKNWGQFRDFDLGVRKLEGFYHGKSSAPYRNVCLGLMKAWESWGESKGWYCYMEYDCLVASDSVGADLAAYDGMCILGNDHRTNGGRIEFLERLQRSRLDLHYLLGCCVFLSRDLIKAMVAEDFFERFLSFTNFNLGEVSVRGPHGREEMAYDLSEFLYPTLCVHYGGKVGELACWQGSGWRGDGARYPMRFRPDLDEGVFDEGCVLHPIKSFNSPVRVHHRSKRSLTRSN